MTLGRGWVHSLWLCALGLSFSAVADMPGQVDLGQSKPRLLVLTDIGNEPDDQMSFVRLFTVHQ